MTEPKHPLTDEMCEKLSPWYTASFSEYDAELMNEGLRDVYDKGAADGRADMLEQVVKWLKATKSTVKLCPSVLAVQLEQAMRPQPEDR